MGAGWRFSRRIMNARFTNRPRVVSKAAAPFKFILCFSEKIKWFWYGFYESLT
jgi:hypothetical protein